MVALDFFCGAGGLTRGLAEAGIKVRAGIDNDRRLKDTYERNNKGCVFYARDVRDVDIVQLRAKAGIKSTDTVIYAACTPCQPFSTLNQRRGNDERKHLLLAFGKLVLDAPPDYVIVENVPGLSNAYGREIYERFQTMLAEAGLTFSDSSLVDASDHGVPQIRKRFILIASKHGPISLPAPLRRRKATVRSVLEEYEDPFLGPHRPKSRSALTSLVPDEHRDPGMHQNHVARKLVAHLETIVANVPKDGGSRSDITNEDVLLDCHRRSPRLHRDVFGRMAWDAPAPTLTCRCTDVYCGRFVHPTENRGLSLREAAAIQSFPNEYVFYGTFFHAATQIGNAVPVKLAKRLGQTLAAADRERRV